MALRQRGNEHVTLDIYGGARSSLDEILDEGCSDNVFIRNFLSLYAGARETGTWAYGMGDQMVHDIRVSFYCNPLSLLGNGSRWIFNLLSHLSLISSERYLDVGEQKRFYAGDKENPPE